MKTFCYRITPDHRGKVAVAVSNDTGDVLLTLHGSSAKVRRELPAATRRLRHAAPIDVSPLDDVARRIHWTRRSDVTNVFRITRDALNTGVIRVTVLGRLDVRDEERAVKAARLYWQTVKPIANENDPNPRFPRPNAWPSPFEPAPSGSMSPGLCCLMKLAPTPTPLASALQGPVPS